MKLKVRRVALLATMLSVLLVLPFAVPQPAKAATAIMAYKAQTPVTLDGIAQPGEWSDTPMVVEPTSTITYAFKQNGTGLLFLLEWQSSSGNCYDVSCFGGIEVSNSSNYGEMGSPSTPTIMLLLSQGFKGGYDEFISSGDVTPTPVEDAGYKTQSACVLQMTGSNYVSECYRPFHGNGAVPNDPFGLLASGTPIEIAFAIGEFSSPGLHSATDMVTYTLAISDQPYSGASTTTSTPSGSSTTTTPVTTSSQASPGQNWFEGFPGLNLVTLYVTAGLALAIGAILGIGVALRARKARAAK